MGSSTLRLESSIRDHLAPVLRNDGFSGSGRTFRRVLGDLIHLCSVQGSRHGGELAVNLGIREAGQPERGGPL